MVFYCEQAAGYCQDIGYQEEGFFDALVRMFEQALQSANTLPANGRHSLIARLNRVREIVTPLVTALATIWTTSWPNTSSIPTEGREVGAGGGSPVSIAQTCWKLTQDHTPEYHWLKIM